MISNLAVNLVEEAGKIRKVLQKKAPQGKALQARRGRLVKKALRERALQAGRVHQVKRDHQARRVLRVGKTAVVILLEALKVQEKARLVKSVIEIV